MISCSPIRVLIVDDSAAMRQLLAAILSSDPLIEVVGTAADPYFARNKIRTLRPDVLTLDVEMPRMDGLTFLEKLMQAHPMPVVMVSAMTQAGFEVTMRALELGAIDYFPKPTIDTLSGVQGDAANIIALVKAAASAHVPNRAARAEIPVAKPPAGATTALRMATQRIVAIGASTGGTEAIREVLGEWPEDMAGTVIVQHMPAGFTASFAARLDGMCAMRVKEAADGDRVLPGHVFIAPGDFHTSIVRSGAEYVLRVQSGPPVNRHRPSVDVLFESCAAQAGKNAVAALLTGMGSDGARGLRAIYDAGGRTIAQDEESCVVFGMPREAIEFGGAEAVLPLNRIAGELMSRVSSPAGSPKAA